mmetsp:Transcript_24725/g.36253  ORF Transcript_24725/g.36253 Transcript_24725/m.36253 type:complete len:341 (-) Transcript_24725:145-1167(-)
MPTPSAKARSFLILALCCLSVAFSSSSSPKPFVAIERNSAAKYMHATAFSTAPLRCRFPVPLTKGCTALLNIRGGEQEEVSSLAEDVAVDEAIIEEESVDIEAVDEQTISEEASTAEETAVDEASYVEASIDDEAPTPEEIPSTAKSSALAPVAFLQTIGSAYSTQLTNRPILTKSITASIIFGLSDWTAQKLEGKDDDDEGAKMNWTRIISASLVGLLYFGPAAHGWYETIFRLLPKQSLISTLQKAALGQLLFGPSFTCVFFATSLMQSGEFTLGTWFKKIKSDLPGAWAAGLGFWPLVDLFSYSVLPSRWIPLFVNVCSYVWTIYLSFIANKRAEAE